MQHSVKLTPAERIREWWERCDFSYRLMKAGLSKKEFEKRLREMRAEGEAKNLF
jgi:hypothetical protein